MTSAFSSVFDSVTRKIKSFKQTPFEKRVSEATSNDNWGVANSTLIELARETFDYSNCGIILREIFEALSDKKEKWRRVFKGLSLLEYCVKYGSERVVSEARSESGKLRALEDFKFMEAGRDKGPGIREKSKYLIDLLGNAEELKSERAKAQQSKERYAGLSSGGAAPVPSGYVNTPPGTAASVGHVSSENTTAKLDEYREKEKMREKQVNVNIAPSGKIVVNKSGLVGGNQSAPKVSSNLISDASSSSTPEKKHVVDNLIDFDAPVSVVQKPSLCDPSFTQSAPKPLAAVQQGMSNPYSQPQVNPGNPYMQQPVTSLTNPYIPQQQGTSCTAPYMQQQGFQSGSVNPYMQQPNSVKSSQPMSGNPYMQQPTQPVVSNPYNTLTQNAYMQPVSQPMTGNPYNQNYQSGSPYMGASASVPQQTNPFAAFNGL